MHIMEGYLEPQWCIIWFACLAPFLAVGLQRLRATLRSSPEQKMLIGVSGAFVFLMSSLKLPSVTGSSSHPTGTGFTCVFYGVCVCSVISIIVLLFQCLLIAHGGLTTLGANCLSMGVVGPLAGIAVWKLMRRAGANIFVSMFAAGAVADFIAYVWTSVEMTLNIVTSTGAGFLSSFGDFLSVYAVTQIPLALVDGMIMAFFVNYLHSTRPELFGSAGDEGRCLDTD